MNLKEELYKNQDLKYKEFNSNLTPTINKDTIIGVRVPVLRKLSKQLFDEGYKDFMQVLPHTYFEENMVHSFLITQIKDYEECIEELNRFLPFVDNWAVSDALSCKNLKKHRAKLLQQIPAWIQNEHPYAKRVGILLLMTHFLEEDFKEEYFDLVINVHSEDYYVNMMIAWYFAEALAKRWDDAIVVIENQKLDRWCHNKAIQKAVESLRITPEKKQYLKMLKIKK